MELFLAFPRILPVKNRDSDLKVMAWSDLELGKKKSF